MNLSEPVAADAKNCHQSSCTGATSQAIYDIHAEQESSLSKHGHAAQQATEGHSPEALSLR